jgi:hypothetical protein
MDRRHDHDEDVGEEIHARRIRDGAGGVKTGRKLVR